MTTKEITTYKDIIKSDVYTKKEYDSLAYFIETSSTLDEAINKLHTMIRNA